MREFVLVLIDIAIAAVIGLCWALLQSVPFWLLWNLFMPGIFKLPSITWSQALGLCVLFSLIFGGDSSSKK